MERLGPGIVTCMLLGALTSTAHADPAAEARFHDEAARGHYAKGRYELAVREFFLEQRLAPNPRIAFNIGLCFQQLKRMDEAFLYFSEYLAGEDDDQARRATATSAVEQMAPGLARVEVVSDPPGARIFVDKKEHGDYGMTPRVLALAPGEHRIWVALPGHRDAESTVVTKVGSIERVQLAPVRIVGSLSITAASAGAVAIRSADGALVADGPVPLRAELAPGSYEVEVNAPGFAPFKGLAAIKPDLQTDLHAELSRLPEPTGDVTVTANLSGALIELDSDAAGFSPAVISGVPVGTHRVSLSGTGVLAWSGDVQVRPNERVWVTVNLEPPSETRRSPSTWIVGGIGLAGLASGGVVSLFARKAHDDFESAPPEDQAMLRDRGQTLNGVADGLLIGGLVTAGIGVALYFLTEEVVGRASSASVARGAR